jgi:hypothetical protein
MGVKRWVVMSSLDGGYCYLTKQSQIEWTCVLMVISSIQSITFMGQNNQKLILEGILIKVILIIETYNIFVYFT